MDFDLNTVIDMIRVQLDRDLQDPYIHKPYAHALYMVWKTLDVQERPRGNEPDEWTQRKKSTP